MIVYTSSSPWRLTGKLILLGFIASYVGPLLAWLCQLSGGFEENLNEYFMDIYILSLFLWPMSILALGMPEPSTIAYIVLVIANSILYLLIGGLAVIIIALLKIRPLYAFQIMLVIPVFFQLLFAGFDYTFIEPTPFILAMIYYCVIGILASEIMNKSRGIRNNKGQKIK